MKLLNMDNQSSSSPVPTIINGLFSGMDLLMIVLLISVNLYVTCTSWKVVPPSPPPSSSTRYEEMEYEGEVTPIPPPKKQLPQKICFFTSLVGTTTCVVLTAVVVSHLIRAIHDQYSLEPMKPSTAVVLNLIEELGGNLVVNSLFLVLARFHCNSLLRMVKETTTLERRREIISKVQLSVYILEIMLSISAIFPKCIVDIVYYMRLGSASGHILPPSSALFVVKQVFDRYFDVTLAINTFILFIVTIWFSWMYLRVNVVNRKPMIQVAALVHTLVLYMVARFIIVYSKLGVDLSQRYMISSEANEIWYFHSQVYIQCLLLFVQWCLVGPVINKPPTTTSAQEVTTIPQVELTDKETDQQGLIQSAA